MSEFLVHRFMWSVDVVKQLGHAGVLVLMAFENTFLPAPHELVMPRAGNLAANGALGLRLRPARDAVQVLHGGRTEGVIWI